MHAKNNFSQNLKKLRKDNNLTQAEFADLLITPRPTIGAYEEGRAKPSLDKLICIADVFGITIDDLIR